MIAHPDGRDPTGLRLLVVEDDALILMLIENLVTDLGCLVVGAATTVPQALELLQTVPFDGALLDGNLDGQTSEPIAHALLDNGIPFIVVTGYRAPPVSGGPVVQKPFQNNELQDQIIQHLLPRRNLQR